MQTSNRLLDDLAKVASGAATALTGVREELDGLIRARIERYMADLAVVTREEFDAVRQTAANARAEQEKLEKRVAELEAKLAATSKRPSSAAKPEPSHTDPADTEPSHTKPTDTEPADTKPSETDPS